MTPTEEILRAALYKAAYLVETMAQQLVELRAVVSEVQPSPPKVVRCEGCQAEVTR